MSSAIFFPKTILPLNIFEDRYIQLVNDAMKENRMFGMVQPKNREASLGVFKYFNWGLGICRRDRMYANAAFFSCGVSEMCPHTLHWRIELL